jgi:hypothetical protein
MMCCCTELVKYRYTSRRKERQRHSFLTWPLGGHEWPASYSSQMSPVYIGWMLCRPRVGLGAVQMRTLPCLYRQSSPGSSANQPVLQSLYRRSYSGFFLKSLRWCLLVMYTCYCIPCRLLLFVYWNTKHVTRRGFFFFVELISCFCFESLPWFTSA